MQEQKDGQLIKRQPPKGITPEEEKLLDLMAKLIVDITLKDTSIASPDTSPEKALNPGDPFAE